MYEWVLRLIGYLRSLSFATPFEAESFINSNLDELDLPVMVRLEDMKGNVKWYYDLVEDEGAVYRLVDRDCESTHLIRVGSN